MDHSLFHPRRFLRQGLPPAELSIETPLLTPLEFRCVNGVPRPTSIEITAEELQREDAACSTLSLPPVAGPLPVVTIDVAEELSPLFEFLNAQGSPYRPLV